MKRCITTFCLMSGILLLLAGTVAYFSNVINGSITAQGGIISLSVTGFDDNVNKSITLGIIKPGDEGEFTLNIDASGSKSDVIYTVDIVRTNLPTNLKFYYDEEHITPFANCSKFMEESASMVESVTVYWYWDGNVSNEDDNLFQNVSISASINISIEQQVYGMMKNGYNFNPADENHFLASEDLSEAFWHFTYRQYISEITFSNDLKGMPDTCNEANLCWDISEVGSKYPVYGYMVSNGETYTDGDDVLHNLYNLYIVCSRTIYAPIDSSNLFANFINLITINFNDVFSTALTTNMSYMFAIDYIIVKYVYMVPVGVSEYVTPSLLNNVTLIEDSDYYMVEYNYISNLINLDLNTFNTSNTTDMQGMFDDCSSLTSLDVSGFNTSNVTDMQGMFFGCSSLTSLDVSDFNTINVTSMRSMFSDCSSLTNLNLDCFNVSSVTDMCFMFDGCSSLTTLNLNKFNTSSLIEMYYMFRGCTGFTSLNLSNFNTINVTNMGSMFYGCSSLTSLDLSNFNTSKVTSMSSMFYRCSSLTSLDLSNFNTGNVINMGNMFRMCDNLVDLYLDNFSFVSVIGTTSQYSHNGLFGMFFDSPKISVTINMDGVGILQYGYMFSNAATDPSALITVNYTAETSTLVDNMILTKSASSNVVKGSLIS